MVLTLFEEVFEHNFGTLTSYGLATEPLYDIIGAYLTVVNKY